MLKIKDCFFVSQVANENIVLSLEEDLNLDHVMTMNETGRFLWDRLAQETTEEALVKALLEEYEVTEERAAAAVQSFLGKLREAGVLEEN